MIARGGGGSSVEVAGYAAINIRSAEDSIVKESRFHSGVGR